jgi:hypothetical protein
VPSSSFHLYTADILFSLCVLSDVLRASSIRWAGPLWSLTFLLPFFPWHDSLKGIHFAVSMCACTHFFHLVVSMSFALVLVLFADDAAVTYVSLAHSAYLSEVATSPAQRTTWNSYSSLCGVAGASLLFARFVYRGCRLIVHCSPL